MKNEWERRCFRGFPVRFIARFFDVLFSDLFCIAFYGLER